MNGIASVGCTDASPLARQMPPRSDPTQMRWSRFLAATEAEGPGQRASVWVQGCRVSCPGCFNPQLWANRGGLLSDPSQLTALWIREALAAGSTGVTLLGGEPFDQAAALAPLAQRFQQAGLGVMAFSGYRHEDLAVWAEHRTDIADLLASVDLLCDGPYLREHPDHLRPWIGSTNQSIRALTPRYADEVRNIARHGRGADRIEIRVAADGVVSLNGWADTDALETLLEGIGARIDQPHRVAASAVADGDHEENTP